jgi:hypothetical protein
LGWLGSSGLSLSLYCWGMRSVLLRLGLDVLFI